MTNRCMQWDAEDYARHSAAQTVWARELMAKLDLRRASELLDIGCGDGKVTAALAQRMASANGRVVGIDASANMIALAKRRFSRDGSVNFMQMDARHLDLPYSFDVVFSNAVLHWIEDHLSVLRGMARHTRPGAEILLQMGGQGNGEMFFATVHNICAKAAWARYFQAWEFPYFFYAPEDYAQWLPACGFTAQRIELIPKLMRFADPRGFAGWLRTTGMPFTQRVPEHKRQVFIEQIVAAYQERVPRNTQGEVTVEMVRLEVHARRAKTGRRDTAYSATQFNN